MRDRYHSDRNRRYGVTHAGHEIELEFDKKLVVLNRARLFVDGTLVDAERVVYGEKELTTTLEDGTEVHVTIDSGMVGELTRAQLRDAHGSWIDLAEREPAA